MWVPGRSYAINVARNLGLSEDLLELAESYLVPEHASAESLLNQIQLERNQIADAREKAQEDAIAAEAARRDLETRLAQITRKQDDVVQRTRMSLRREADDVRRQLRRIVSEAESDRNLAAAQKAVNRLRSNLAQPTWLPITDATEVTPEQPAPATSERPLRDGDEVEIKGLDVRAKIVSIAGDGTVDLQMGNARIQLNAGQLRLVEPAQDPGDEKKERVRVSKASAGPVSDELDVRGHRAVAVVDMVEQFLDRCTVAGLDRCRIIHGAGTGALRQAVRDYLASAQQVGSFSPAPADQGGNGATIVELA
jgi:DNA mismatch repair protein MutS2